MDASKPAFLMRRTAWIGALAGVWALGPILGSPSSLYIVPTVAVVSALAGRTHVEAYTLALGSLVVMGAGWVVVGAANGAPLFDRATTGAGLVAIHGVAAALLVALAWWIRGRARSVWTQVRPSEP